MDTLNDTTRMILQVRQPGTGIDKFTFKSETARSQTFNKVVRALPALYDLDQRLLRVESNIARIIQINGNKLSARHFNQIHRLANIYNQYQQMRTPFVSAIRSMTTTLASDVTRHIFTQRNQLNRSTTPPRNIDSRVTNYQQGRIDRLVKVRGDYGVRVMLEKLRANPKLGREYLQKESIKIHNMFEKRTGGRPSARPKQGRARTPMGNQLSDIVPASSL